MSDQIVLNPAGQAPVSRGDDRVSLPGNRDSSTSLLLSGLRMLFSKSVMVVLGALLGLTFSVVYLSYAKPLYTARMVIGPSQPATGLQSEVGGLRQQLNLLTGGDVGGENAVTPYALFNELLTSAALAQRLQDRYHVLQELYPASWDAQHGTWRKPTGIVPSLRGRIRTMFGRAAWTPPNVVDLQNLLKSGVSAVMDNGSQYFRVYSYQNADPQKAAWFLSLLYEEADAEAREITLRRATALAAYIQNKMNTIKELDYRTALYSELAQQDMLKVLSMSNTPFAAQLIDPPRSSSVPTDPDIMKTVLVSTLLGAIFGLIAAYAFAWAGVLRRPARNADGVT